MIKSIIVEDDPAYSDRLIELLEKCNEQVKVLAVATNVDAALVAIKKFSPDLVFLDIQLEGGQSGFDLLKRTETISFDVIFTTSHITTDNTIRAIRACALDFLPKPILFEELQNAIIKHLENKQVDVLKLGALKKNLEVDNGNINWIWVAKGSNNVKLEIKNIIYCMSDDKYTEFFLCVQSENKERHISSKGLKEWEDILKNTNIIRIHNEHMVNIDYVKSCTKGEGAYVIMTNGKKLPISESRKENFLKRSGLK